MTIEQAYVIGVNLNFVHEELLLEIPFEFHKLFLATVSRARNSIVGLPYVAVLREARRGSARSPCQKSGSLCPQAFRRYGYPWIYPWILPWHNTIAQNLCKFQQVTNYLLIAHF